jgi:hypothetical protein
MTAVTSDGVAYGTRRWKTVSKRKLWRTKATRNERYCLASRKKVISKEGIEKRRKGKKT